MNAIRVPQVGEIGQYADPDSIPTRPIAALVVGVVESDQPEMYPRIQIHTFWPHNAYYKAGPSVIPSAGVPLAETLTAGCWSPLPSPFAGLAEIAPMESVTSLLRAEAPATHIHLHLDGLAAK